MTRFSKEVISSCWLVAFCAIFLSICMIADSAKTFFESLNKTPVVNLNIATGDSEINDNKVIKVTPPVRRE